MSALETRMAAASNVIHLKLPRPSDLPSGAEHDDAAIARGLRAHDPGAERAFLERHTPRVERILTRILGLSAELDDLVQEVFVRAFERVSELRDAGALKP